MYTRKRISCFSACLVFSLIMSIVDTSGALNTDKLKWGPTNGISLGPFAGWVGGNTDGNTVESGVATGLDFTYFHKIVFPLYFFASTGARIWIEDGEVPVIPYVEAGLSVLLISTGVGYGIMLNSKDRLGHTLHLFIGVSIPLWSPSKYQLFYVEPYYKPTWDLSSDDRALSHEVGGLIKWSLGFK